jgi:uncharacterized spore protein YtfJ
MHAMGGSLAAALLAAQRLVALAGDRGSLLVAQDVSVAVASLLRTGTSTSGMAAAGLGAAETGSRGSGSGAGAGRGALVQQWMQRLREEGAHGLQHLLPNHKCLNSAAANALDGVVAGSSSGSSLQQKLVHSSSDRNGSSSGSGSGCSTNDAAELTEEQVLLMRVQQLTEWAESEQYQQLMAAARPLRRVVQRGRVPSA